MLSRARHSFRTTKQVRVVCNERVAEQFGNVNNKQGSNYKEQNKKDGYMPEKKSSETNQ
jgi:hypothetical protein